MSKKNKQKPTPIATPKTAAPLQNNTLISEPKEPKVSFSLLEKIQGREWVIGSVLLVLVGCIVYKDYVFGNALFFFRDIGCDSLNTIYPNIVFHSEYLRTEGLPAWSFQQGMGQNIYPFWFDQFYVILYLMSPTIALKSTGTLQMIELILAGAMFMAYLKTIRLSSISVVIGGLCYAFCGFTVACGGWDNRFVVEAFNIALLLLALERFIQKDSWWLLPIPIALTAINQPFDLYIFGILMLIYTVFRITEVQGWKPQLILTSLLRMAVISAIGVGLSSIMLLENIQQLLNSPRVSGGESHASELTSGNTFKYGNFYGTILARFFGNDLFGTGNEHKGWSNYFEAPFLYFGLISLLAAPQWVYFQKFNKRLLYLSLVVLVAIVLAIPNIRFAFWLFTGDYFRTLTLFVGIFLLYMSTQAIAKIEQEGKISWIVLGGTLVMLIACLFSLNTDLIDKGMRFMVVAFLVINALLLGALSSSAFRVLGQIGLLLVVIVELVLIPSKSINPDKRKAISVSDLTEKAVYNDYSIDALAFVKQQDQGFYRVDKLFTSSTSDFLSLSDAKAQHYFGTKSYHSFNQLNYIKFLKGVDVIKPTDDETKSRWAEGVSSNLLLQSLCSVKYLMTKEANLANYKGMSWDSLGHFGDITLLRNRLVVPLGAGFDHYMLAEDFTKLGSVAKSFALLKAVVLEKEQMEQYQYLKPLLADSVSAAPTIAEYQQATQKRQSQSMIISKFTNNRIEGSIELNAPQMVFFAIPFDEGWQAEVDGKVQRLDKIDIGLMGLSVEKGKHNIILQYTVPLRKTGTMLSLFMLVVFGGLIFFFRRKDV